MRKKTSIYPTEKQCLLSKNIIAEYFSEELDIIVDKFNDFNQEFTTIVDEDGNISGLTRKDYSFFEEFYTPSESLKIKDELLEQKFPDLKENEIGNSEWQLIKFSSSLEDTKNNRLRFVIGNIGEGKSTLINYVYKYLYNNKESLPKRFIPILINCHGYLSKIKSAKEKGQTLDDFLDSLIKQRVLDKFRNEITISNEKFWSWYNENIISNYREELLDIEAFNYEKEEKEREIKILRKKEKKENDNFYVHAISYAISVKRRQIVIVFDNVDPFDIDTICDFYWKAKNYINQAPIKVIITIRKDTFRKLQEKIANTAVLRTIQVETKLDEILKNRCNKLLEKVENANKMRPLVFTSESITYSTKINPISHLSKLINAILDDYSINFIPIFAKRNIRNELEILRIIVESGFIPNSVLHKSLFDTDEKIISVPPEYILSSIITFGYGTYFTSLSREFKIPGVLNMLSNSYHSNHIQLFSKLYILNYLQKKGFRGETKRTQIIEIYSKCIEKMNDAKELMEAFKYSFYRLFNAGLVSSPDIHHVENQEEFELLVNDIRISKLGEFYFGTLLSSPFYLFFVKDDVYLDNINDFEDAHYVLENYKKERYFWTNFKNLIIFLKEYGLSEIETIKKYVEFNTFDDVCQNFSCKNHKLFAIKILYDLQSFSNSKIENSNFQVSFFDKNQIFYSSDISELHNTIIYLENEYHKIISK